MDESVRDAHVREPRFTQKLKSSNESHEPTMATGIKTNCSTVWISHDYVCTCWPCMILLDPQELYHQSGPAGV